MSSYRFTPQAIDDLFEIWSYIATDDVEAADRVEEALHAACAFLANSPLAGRVRDDLTPLPVRFWLARPYRITGLCTILRPGRCKSSASFTRPETFHPFCRPSTMTFPLVAAQHRKHRPQRLERLFIQHPRRAPMIPKHRRERPAPAGRFGQ